VQFRTVHLNTAQQHNTVSIYDVHTGVRVTAVWAQSSKPASLGQAADGEPAGRSHHTAEQLFSEPSYDSYAEHGRLRHGLPAEALLRANKPKARGV
jgi:hypothetical protein